MAILLMTSSASATAIITIGDSNSDIFSEANVTVTVPLNIEDVAAEVEVKAVGGVNDSSELEGSKKNWRGGNGKSTFSGDMDMRFGVVLLLVLVITGMRQQQYDIKLKK